MKKLLKGIFAFVLAASCITSLPVVNADNVQIEDKVHLDLSSSTGYAYKKTETGVENIESSGAIGNSNEGPVEYILDNNADTLFHSSSDANNWAAIPSANFPVYIVIDFDTPKTFDEFTLQNRNDANKDDIHTYKLWINNSSTWIDSKDVTNANWSLISSNVDGTALQPNTVNQVELGQDYTASQIMFEIVATRNIAENAPDSYITILDFDLYDSIIFDAATASEQMVTLDRSNWSGAAYDDGGNCEYRGGQYSDRGVNEGLLEDAENMQFHTGGASSYDKGTLPMYIVIDLDETSTEPNVSFSQMQLKVATSRSDRIKEFEVYVNETNEDKSGTATDSSYTVADWGEKIYSGETTAATNVFEFDRTYTASQIMIKVTSVHSNATSDTWVVADDLKLLNKEYVVSTELDRTNWKVAAYIYETESVSEANDTETAYEETSTANEGPAENMLDGDSSTHWHSNWNDRSTGYGDFSVIFKLGAESRFNAFTWLGRADLANGDIEKYRFYTINNKENIDENILPSDSRWGEPLVVDGTVASGGDVVEKFVGDTTATHVMIRMTGKADNSGHHGSCSEFRLYYDERYTGQTDAVFTKLAYGNAWAFESNYANASLETPLKSANDTSFMRYVTKDVMDIKVQAGTIANEQVDARFVSTVPSLNLEQIGFIITVNGKSRVSTGTTVYETLNSQSNGTTVINEPDFNYNKAASKYFSAVNLLGIPTADTTTSIRVQAFWVPNGGAKIVVPNNALSSEELDVLFADSDVVFGDYRDITVADLVAASPSSTAE